MPPHPARRLATFAVAGTLLASLAACGDDDSDSSSSEADTEESSLLVYAGRDESLLGPLLEQFEEESGIDLEIRYADTPEHAATLLEEGEQTSADVFISQDAGALGELAREGMLLDLPDDITSAVKADYTSQDGSWVGITGRARVFAYDGEALEESDVPGQVEAFADPEWEGRVGLAPGNASFQSFVTGFRAAEGDDAAQTWLEAMADNDPAKFESNSETLEAVNEGVVEIGLINHYYLYALREEIGEENVTAQMKFPDAGDPGALVNVTGAGVLSDNEDALELARYLVSETAQEYFVENTFEYPLVEGVDAPDGLPVLEDIEGPIEDLSDLYDLEASVQMIQEAGLS